MAIKITENEWKKKQLIYLTGCRQWKQNSNFNVNPFTIWKEEEKDWIARKALDISL